MHPWLFTGRRSARSVPAPTDQLGLDGSFHWESADYLQRRADRVRERRHEIDAMVAERAEHHPRARAAYDGHIAGSTASWHTEDTHEHDKALGRLRQMRVRADVVRAGSLARLQAAQDDHELALRNWRACRLRLGDELADETDDADRTGAPGGRSLPEVDGGRHGLPDAVRPMLVNAPPPEPPASDRGRGEDHPTPDRAIDDDWWDGPAPSDPDPDDPPAGDDSSPPGDHEGPADPARGDQDRRDRHGHRASPVDEEDR